MFEFINNILLCFRSCFSRKAAFHWFVIVIVGFLVRSDTLGVTSIIRDLAILPSLYPCLIHFFRADRTCDGKFMPCVKKMVQESERAKKPPFIHGHFFGAVGVLIGSTTKSFCLPLSIRFHDGDQAILGWFEEQTPSHIVQMLGNGICAAKYFGNSLLVLDRYFLSVPLLELWKSFQAEFPNKLHIVTRAKKNCVAYEKPEPYKGRGRRPIRGNAVHLQELFVSEADSFQEATLTMYGCEKKVRFLSKTYLWGQKLYQPLQFVLVEVDGKQIILVSTDLTMTPEDIITAYAYRFKIEAMFREMKQQVGAFFYHFWTKSTPKLDRYRKKGTSDPFEKVTDKNAQIKILETLMAMERYLLLCCIATGILQLLCLKYEGKIQVSQFRYLRTPSKSVLSEKSMMTYLHKNLFRFMAKQRELTITKIISNKQTSLENEEFDLFIS